MSYVASGTRGRSFAGLRGLGAWDSRWGYGLGGWQDDVTTAWYKVRTDLWAALNRMQDRMSVTDFGNYQAAVVRLDATYGKVLAGEVAPKVFAETCRKMLEAVQAPTESYTAVDALAFVAKGTVADVKRVAKTTVEDLAHEAGRVVSIAAGGAAEGAGLPTWMGLGLLVAGVGALAWWKLR